MAKCRKLVARIWWWRADRMEKGLLKAIKYNHKASFQKMMAVINKYGPKRIAIGTGKNLKPIHYMLDF